jgi:hypothetical protein
VIEVRAQLLLAGNHCERQIDCFIGGAGQNEARREEAHYVILAFEHAARFPRQHDGKDVCVAGCLVHGESEISVRASAWNALADSSPRTTRSACNRQPRR